MSIAPADSTVVAIRKKIRRLTASASESSLKDVDIDQYLNTYYSQDFPYSIKLDVMRSVYTFYTEPYRDRYPLDVNYNQGIRAPMYVDGISGSFYKDRTQYFNIWPKFPTLFHPINGDGVTTAFTFTVPGPFLSKQVTLGGVDANGNAISVADDGNGNLQLQVPNPVVSVPAQYNSPPVIPPIPGMKNLNTANPGLSYVDTTTLDIFGNPYPAGIGQVNYVSGLFSINFPVAPAAGTQMTLWVSQYQTGRPYSLLFWNNEFTVRPVPKLIHKIEIETYLTPVQFLETTDVPILNQWWQLLALGAAIKVLEDRQDMEGVQNLSVLFDRQEALCLERQSIEEIFTPNYTIFNSSTPAAGGVGGIGYW